MRRCWSTRALTLATLLATTLFTALAYASPAAADSIRDKQWYLDTLGIAKAWSVTRGSGVNACIIDSGVSDKVPELRGVVVAGKDFTGYSSGNGVKPYDSHGTEIASLLAGRGTGVGGRDGVIGVAPQAKIVSAQVTSGRPDPNAIKYCVDQGAQVISISLSVDDSAAMRSALAYAEQKQVVVVASAGNDGPGAAALPALYPGVVGVSGIDRSGRVDPSSSTGTGIAIAAPMSTKPTRGGVSAADGDGLVARHAPGDPFGPYGTVSGTSFAAPLVAGVVALIRAEYPNLDAANIVNRLLQTASPAGRGRPNSTYGYGIVNADAALTANVPPVATNPLGSFLASSPSSSVPATSRSAPVPATSPVVSASPVATPVPTTSSAPAPAASSAPSGLGTGAWVAIAVVVLAAAALVVVLVARSRRPHPPSSGAG